MQKKGIKWEDYPFARFNKKVQLLVYSDEEYEALLRSEQWTREQTDDLMLLVQQFHLNFFLVQDRWQGSGSVDWLKDRCGECTHTLLLVAAGRRGDLTCGLDTAGIMKYNASCTSRASSHRLLKTIRCFRNPSIGNGRRSANSKCLQQASDPRKSTKRRLQS